MKSLNENETYPCPVCRTGEVKALPLMEDTFSCEFCQHLFTASFSQQVLKMMDSEIPLSWYWDGKKWSNPYRKGLNIGWEYWGLGLLFITLPPLIVGAGAYLFPTIPGTPLAWLPTVWTILTFIAHFVILIWLIVEYYQFPVVMYLRTRMQRHS
ncbi:MAG: hypothetical protein ACLFQP_10000 [Halothece sp.]